MLLQSSEVVLYLLFSTKAVCGAKTRLKPGAYDSSDGLPNNGLHIEGIYVAINATATPVRLARSKWATGGIFPNFFLENNDNRSRLQSSQSCVTPSAIFVFAFRGDTCRLLYVLASDWRNASEIVRGRAKNLRNKGCLENSNPTSTGREKLSVKENLTGKFKMSARTPVKKCYNPLKSTTLAWCHGHFFLARGREKRSYNAEREEENAKRYKR